MRARSITSGASLPAALVIPHRANNRDTSDRWARFEPHRRRLTALVNEACGDVVQGAADGGADVCVLGAGNLNDLDLEALVPSLRALHLVDLDADAVNRACARQHERSRALLQVHAPVDLTGALARLARWRDGGPTPGQLGALPARVAASVSEALGRSFDVVVSACLLSQLLDSCGRAMGARHPALLPVAAALVVGHLRSVVGLLREGGVALVVTDTVDDATYPLESMVSEIGLRDTLMRAAAEERCFTGTSPSFLSRILGSDDVLAPQVTAPQLEEPWLWPFDRARTYLVYALRMSRR